MHNSQALSMKRLVGLLTVLFLSISIILPPMAAAYGDSGGSGGSSETDKPANNRAFDDTPPSVPATHFAADPMFGFNPAAIPDKRGQDFWTSQEWCGMLQAADLTGTIAAFFIPLGWPKALITAAKLFATARDPAKRAMAWRVLNEVKQAYNSSTRGQTPGGVGTGNTANK